MTEGRLPVSTRDGQLDVRELNEGAAANWVSSNCQFFGFALAFPADKRIYRGLDALARAYGPWGYATT